MKKMQPRTPKGGVLLAGSLLALLAAGAAVAIQPADPGTGYDYVFYGYAPPFSPPLENSRTMLLLDIDDRPDGPPPNSPRPSRWEKNFKLLAFNPTKGVRIDLGSYTQHVVPTMPPGIFIVDGAQDTRPERWVFVFNGNSANGDTFRINQDAILEPYANTYLRSVIDVVHTPLGGTPARVRLLANCEYNECAVESEPYEP